MNVKGLIKNAGFFLQKNSPYILTGFGAAGVVTTAALSAKAAVKSVRLIDAHLEEGMILDKKDKVGLVWKYWISPFAIGLVSVGCIFGAQSVNTRRNAALTSLYTLTESTLKDYREKVKEQLSEKKEQKIFEESRQKVLDRHPASQSEIIVTGDGDSLCYDALSGRYFKSSIEKLRRIQNDFNHDLMGLMWVSINDLYCMMGLGPIKLGDEIGWTVDELLDFRFSTNLSDDKKPCIVVDYDVTPRSFKGPLWG